MQKNVETIIGRLATDATLRRRFAAAPTALLTELGEQGLELTPVERAALTALDVTALQTLAEALDRRLRRACLVPHQEKKT